MKNISITHEDAQVLLDAYQNIGSTITDKIGHLQRSLKTGTVGPSTKLQSKKGRRTLSAAARERIAAAQRKRWALVRRDGRQATKGAKKPKAMTAGA